MPEWFLVGRVQREYQVTCLHGYLTVKDVIPVINEEKIPKHMMFETELLSWMFVEYEYPFGINDNRR